MGKEKNIHHLDEIKRKVSGLENIVPNQGESPHSRNSTKGIRKSKKSIQWPGDITNLM